jgi:P pilus assembly chaperone PapD
VLPLGPSAKRVKIWISPKFWRFNVIPPRFTPEGVLQLIEFRGEEKILLQELPMSSKNRDKINKIRNDLLMSDPTLNLAVGENNSIRITKDERVPQVHNDL